MTNARWVQYFEANLDREARLPWEAPLTISGRLRSPLAHSLQRFQLGESGEGTCLKRWARATGDPDYCRAIELFVSEEQHHSRWFGHLLERLDVPNLQSHWSSATFAFVRRAGGLRFELMTFLVAEIVGKRFFAALARNINCPLASAVFSQVVRDEAAHIAFHLSTLQRAFATQNALQRRCTRAVWKGLMLAALSIICRDHADVLHELQISRRHFRSDCLWLFEDVVRRVYAPQTENDEASLPDKAEKVVLEVLRSTQVRKEATLGCRHGVMSG